MIQALGFAVVFVVAAAAAALFRMGSLRVLARWHLDPDAPVVVRNLPFFLIPVAALALAGLVMIGLVRTTFLSHTLVTLVLTLAIMGLFLGSSWVALVPPDWVKPRWLRDATPLHIVGPPASSVPETPAAVATTAWAPPTPWRAPEGESAYNGRPAVAPPAVAPFGAQAAAGEGTSTEVLPAAVADEVDTDVVPAETDETVDDEARPYEGERPPSWSWAGGAKREPAPIAGHPPSDELAPEPETDAAAAPEPSGEPSLAAAPEPEPDARGAKGEAGAAEEPAPRAPVVKAYEPEGGAEADAAARRAGWG